MSEAFETIWLKDCQKTIRIKYLCTNAFSGGTPSTSNSNYWDGTIPWIASGKAQNCDIDEASEYITELGLKNSSTRLIKPYSPVIAMTGATCANIGFLTINACSNQSIFAYEIDETKAYPKYVFYSLIAARPTILNYQQGGAVGGINGDVCKNLYLPNLDLQKQIIISSFLDKKCNSINEMIKKEEKAIDELKRYRKAFISQSVSNGIVKHDYTVVRNKWFKKIPSSWSLLKIRYVVSLENGIKVGPFGSSLTGRVSYDETNIKVYGQWNVIAGDFSIDRNFIKNDAYEPLKNYDVKSGDILISMMGTIGKCKTVPNGIDPGVMDSHIIKIKLSNILNPRYFEYFYDKDNSYMVSEQLEYLKKGSIMDGLNSTVLKEIFVCVPPVKEQEEIVKFLDDKCSKIDELISLKEEKIKALKQYKESLIYECVIGKKEAPYAN